MEEDQDQPSTPAPYEEVVVEAPLRGFTDRPECPKCTSRLASRQYHPSLTCWVTDHTNRLRSKIGNEHLHFTCQDCAYAWMGDVAIPG